jgi:hypothetical protein
MDASLGLRSAKIDPAGYFRSRGWFIFLCQKCSSFVGAENQRGATTICKT